jgi:hypothetical protein
MKTKVIYFDEVLEGKPKSEKSGESEKQTDFENIVQKV